MINLIVGKPRSGKTQFAVKLIFDQIELNQKYQAKLDSGKQLDRNKNEVIRTVYSDIADLKIDGVQLAPNDWRDVPDDSVIFYDEVHFRKEYEDLNGKPSQNPMIKELTTHGHRNIDIYLITQASSRIERSIRGLVDCIYYAKRPQQKPNFCMIYEFDKFYNEPAYAAQKVLEHDKYMFKFNDKYQNAYKSASAHTSVKFKVQRKFIWAIIAIIVMASLAVKLMLSGGFIDLVKKGTDQKEDTAQTAEQVKSDKFASDLSVMNLNDECRKAENVQKPECVKWFDDLTKNNGSVYTGDNGQTVVSYNPNKPFDTEEIQRQVRYQITSNPVFSGCMKKNGKYTAYTEQGTILHDVSDADCRRLLENGDRPYNYFKEKNQNQLVQQNAVLDTNNENHAKQTIEYANNIVEPHLQKNLQVNGANAL